MKYNLTLRTLRRKTVSVKLSSLKPGSTVVSASSYYDRHRERDWRPPVYIVTNESTPRYRVLINLKNGKRVNQPLDYKVVPVKSAADVCTR